MGANSSIEWTDHTFNGWIGCTKVSVGPQGACENCYAEVSTPVRAMHIGWGPGKPRHLTSPATWALPLKWERNAYAFHAVHGRRQRVFCASLADVFDNEVDPQWRADLMRLICDTPHLDWLLLTKRIGNAASMVMEAGDFIDYGEGWQSLWGQGEWPKNVWLGATIANQEEADRDIPKLLATPARIHFLSCEPLLGEINLRALDQGDGLKLDALFGTWSAHGEAISWPDAQASLAQLPTLPTILPPVSWVIAGGESGPKARPMHVDWLRSLRDQCIATHTPFHLKQWGQFIHASQDEARQFSYDDENCEHIWDASSPTGYSIRVGKKAAGRVLDGRTWNQFPEFT